MAEAAWQGKNPAKAENNYGGLPWLAIYIYTHTHTLFAACKIRAGAEMFDTHARRIFLCVQGVGLSRKGSGFMVMV